MKSCKELLQALRKGDHQKIILALKEFESQLTNEQERVEYEGLLDLSYSQIFVLSNSITNSDMFFYLKFIC